MIINLVTVYAMRLSGNINSGPSNKQRQAQGIFYSTITTALSECSVFDGGASQFVQPRQDIIPNLRNGKTVTNFTKCVIGF